jgi:DnaK suppressor protein
VNSPGTGKISSSATEVALIQASLATRRKLPGLKQHTGSIHPVQCEAIGIASAGQALCIVPGQFRMEFFYDYGGLHVEGVRITARKKNRSRGRDRRGKMTKLELSRYRNVLEAKQGELVQLVRNRDGIVIERSPDALDEVQHATERELAIRNLDRDFILLRSIRGALLRIEDGSFGVCLRCEEDISPKRLAAVPSTPFCIGCQEIADRNRLDGADNFDELMLTVA